MIWNKVRKPGRPRAGHVLSRLVRPLVEKRRFRLILGANLVASILFVRALGPIGGAASFEPVEVAVLSPETLAVLTETTFRVPLAATLGYSQGFNRFHPGVDIRSPLGTEIYPAADGLVVEVEIGRVGYGHKVVVAHRDGLTTLYAHLNKVPVVVGDSVTKDTVLGTVGLTGWTTGPHLHFEVHGPEGLINPKQILPEI